MTAVRLERSGARPWVPRRRVRQRLEAAPRNETGTGPISAIVGVVILFVTLFFTLQTALLLYTRSVVTAAAFDGARLVATGRMSEGEAQSHVAHLLGNLTPRVSWSSDDETVRVTVDADAPSSSITVIRGLSLHVKRTVVVRRERFR